MSNRHDNDDIEARDIAPELMERIPTTEEITRMRNLLKLNDRLSWLIKTAKTWVVVVFAVLSFFLSDAWGSVKIILKKIVGEL